MREGLVSGRLESASRVVEVVGLLPETVVGDSVCWGSIEADLALVPGLLLLRVLKALLLVILPYNRSLLLLFIGLHELEPLSVLHCGLVLDRLLMLLVIQSDRVGVQVEHLPQLVGHVRAHLVIAPVLEPHFQEAFLGPQGQGHADDAGFLELLAYIKSC